MFSLNRVELLGNLTKDPELRFAPNGKAVIKFTVATNHSYKDKEGEWQQIPQFTNVVFWGNSAKIIGQKVKKGNRIYVEGRLVTKTYEQEGITRYTTEVMGNNYIILSKNDFKFEEKF